MDIAKLTINQRAVLRLFDDHNQVNVQLVTRKLNMPRPTAKQVLARLVELGYLNRLGRQRGTYYILRTEEKVADEFGNDVIRVYKGRDAFQRFFTGLQHSLKPGDYYWSFAFKDEYTDIAIRDFLVDFHINLAQKQVEDKTLVHEEAKHTIARIYHNVAGLEIKATMQNIPTGMSITKNSVATLVWGKHPIIIEVKTPVVIDRYHKFFESTWAKALRVTRSTP